MKIYLSGPDVFRPDALAWAESARETCRRHGFEPLLSVSFEEADPIRIFQTNIDLICKAQIVIAVFDPFRGPEPDSGTAFELGYALALGKKVYGYVTRLDTVVQRVALAEGRCDSLAAYGERLTDCQGMGIENFNRPCNLMQAIPIRIVEGGLETCLQLTRACPTQV